MAKLIKFVQANCPFSPWHLWAPKWDLKRHSYTCEFGYVSFHINSISKPGLYVVIKKTQISYVGSFLNILSRVPQPLCCALMQPGNFFSMEVITSHIKSPQLPISTWWEQESFSLLLKRIPRGNPPSFHMSACVWSEYQQEQKYISHLVCFNFIVLIFF